MEVERPPFNDIRIRKALALSIDRDEFVRTLSQGKGGWALAAAFPDTFSQVEIKPMLKRDIDQARSLLRDAGYPDGMEIELPINPTYGQFHVKQGELLQSQAKAAGINLVLKPIDNADYAQRKRARQYTLMYTNKSPAGRDRFLHLQHVLSGPADELYRRQRPQANANAGEPAS
jgi:peptide/nickel transport system substrate-binding protein